MKNLKFERPIAFIDVETTGTSPHSDRIVEISIFKIQPDSSEDYSSHRINPEIQDDIIGPELSKVFSTTYLMLPISTWTMFYNN